MRWIQPMAEPSPSSSPQPLELRNNLATSQFVVQGHWATHATVSGYSTGQDTSMMGGLGAPNHLTCAVSSVRLDNKPRVSPAPCSLPEHISALPAQNIPAPTSQINLATGSDFGSSTEHNTSSYYHPSEFSSSYGQNGYNQYPDVSSENQVGSAEISPNTISPGFTYGYSQSPAAVQTGGVMHQIEQTCGYDDFQRVSDGPLLDPQALNELYLDSDHCSSLQTYQTQGPLSSTETYLERRASSQLQQSFIIAFDGMPLKDEDAWSSAAFSSPSLASFRASPASQQYNASALGTPTIDFEGTPPPHGEPLLSHSISYPVPELRRLSSSSGASSSCASAQRERRGAISQQGQGVPSQVGPSGQSMLDDSVASHLYADGFEPDDSPHWMRNSHFTDDSSTPALSPSTSQEPDFPSEPSVPVRSLRTTRRNTATDSATKSDTSDATALTRQLSSKSDDARGQNGSPRHHPYGRSTRMTAHEQVIHFDTPSIGASDDASDDRETGSRKSKKKSKASKRCQCDYVCPIKGELCGQSVSREADMSRHMQRHRRAEQDMVRDGILAPERQTVFDKLKPSEAVICKGCGESISRKDAFKRHLKNTGKACRPFYPNIVILDD